MQFENHYNWAFEQIIKHATLQRLKSDFIPVIDMGNVTKIEVNALDNAIMISLSRLLATNPIVLLFLF
jgi:hypothetical protein